jgi:hypothetical protein
LNIPQIVDELSIWNMKVEDQLVRFTGRVLPSENIIQGSPRRDELMLLLAGPKVDWTQSVKRNPQLNAQIMPCWVVMVPRNLERETVVFVEALLDGADKMGHTKKCSIDRPVPTQVVTVKAMTNRNLDSIASKVAIQINCKVCYFSLISNLIEEFFTF